MLFIVRYALLGAAFATGGAGLIYVGLCGMVMGYQAGFVVPVAYAINRRQARRNKIAL